MKKSIIALNLIAILLLILSTSCSKYEEGPIISFQSKEKRLINTWELSEILYNGENHEYVGNYTFVFNEDSTGTYSNGYNVFYIKWKFDEDKKNLLVSGINSGAYEYSEIIRLTKDELWLQRERADTIYTMKYLVKE